MELKPRSPLYRTTVYRFTYSKDRTTMASDWDPAGHLPLSVPVHQILLSLAASDRHGYAIIKEIAERTEGDVTLTASTLYGALARMLEAGTIAEVDEPKVDRVDERRRYYALTDRGRALARAEAARLARTLDHARTLGLGSTAGDEAAG